MIWLLIAAACLAAIVGAALYFKDTVQGVSRILAPHTMSGMAAYSWELEMLKINDALVPEDYALALLDFCEENSQSYSQEQRETYFSEQMRHGARIAAAIIGGTPVSDEDRLVQLARSMGIKQSDGSTL